MGSGHRAAFLAAIALFSAAGTADEPTGRLRDLEARLASLEARQAASTAELAAAADAVLRDAERRSTLLAASGEMAAGYDDGFFIRSGAFELRPSIAFVFRNNTSWVSHGKADGSDDWDNGFEVRRVEFEIEGTLFSPSLQYGLVLKTPAGGEPFLDEAFVVSRFVGTPWAVKAGQSRTTSITRKPSASRGNSRRRSRC